MTDRVDVTYEVVGLERVTGCGSLVATATVEVAIAGVTLTLQGVSVRRTHQGRLLCQSPAWRHPRSGKWLPCILLPDELRTAIGAEVVAAVEAPPIREVAAA